MKQKTLLVLVALALIVPQLSSAKEEDVRARIGATTSAKIGSSTEARLKAKADLETRKDAIKDSVQELRDNAVAKMNSAMSKLLMKIGERFQAAVARLQKLSDRIDSRIAKMEAENIDVTKAKSLLVTAKAKIEIAKISSSKIASSTPLLASTTATTTDALKTEYAKFRAIISAAKNDLKTAHSALIDVVKNLKPGFNKSRTATSTKATSTDED